VPGKQNTATGEQEKGFLHLDIDELSKGNGAPIKLELLACLRHSGRVF
jgi:hypothetical protein